MSLCVGNICAGTGRQSLGVRQAEFRRCLAVEIDDTAAASLKSNIVRLTVDNGSEAPVVC